MKSWFALSEGAQVIIQIGAALAALTIFWNKIKKFGLFLWSGVQAVKFVFSQKHDHARIQKQLDALTQSISEIQAEFKPNGGESQHDKLEKLIEMADFQRGFFHATLDTSNVAYFRTDSSGGVVWCNRAFTRLMEVTPAEVMQFGWINIIDDEHEAGYRDRVVQMWLHAVKNQREFNETIYYKTTSGKRFAAHAIAFVISGSGFGLFGHFGEITPLDE
mgnify:CR=1 FL=1